MSEILNRSTTSRFIRPVMSVRGLHSQVDPYVKAEIDILNEILSKKCLSKDVKGNFYIEYEEDKYVEGSKKPKISLEDLLGKNIEDLISILNCLNESSTGQYTFSELIDQKGNASLLYDVNQIIETQIPSYNTNKLLSEPSILSYLFCRAAYHLNLNTGLAIYKYISKDTDDGGIKLFNDYIIISASKKIIRDIRLEVGNTSIFIDKWGQILKSKNINFDEDTFTSAVTRLIKDLKYTYDSEESKLIDKFKDQLGIEHEDIPALINYIKPLKSKGVKIDEKNAPYFLANGVYLIKTSGISDSQVTDTNLTESDFNVKFYEDEKGALEILRENIACAAQMYYSMTLGEELDIFNVTNRIISHYLPSGQVDINSKETLKDLQFYVFNDSFKDQNGIDYKRTHPEERRMFYKQLFNIGGGEIMDGMAVNEDFNILWEKLLFETAKYIEKIAVSQSPTMYVSNQNICQAVEDLQYNLSTHCSGMIKIISPIINKELDFVIERFLKNDEIIKQMAPSNGRSFWKVIERVLTDLRNEVPNVSALRSKAVLGFKILSTTANYEQGDFDDDQKLFNFVSTVEAFIIANEELENRRRVAVPGTGNEYFRETPSNDAAVLGNDWNF